MAFAPSSYIPVGTAAVDTRAREQLSRAFSARPQALSIYMRFVEEGSLLASAYVLYIGNSTTFLEISSNGSFYRTQYNNGISSTVSSTLAAAPSVNQVVELLVTLTAAGVLTISQSIAGGAVTSGSASTARTLPPAWGAATLWINSFSTSGVGFNAFRNIEIQAGVHTMQEMRVRAGTD